MRPAILEQRAALPFRTAKKAAGFMPGPPVVMRYRPKFFGRFYNAALRQGLHGTDNWSKGELELFAAFVSSVNHCVY
ncbi:MAG: hypothetical protein DWQ07_10095 [Chloroflexi bacterium]|nr:MAG: hypothetical protein DWQ07_10095 [Chloroflexota bacterium]MBL1192938.1 hypothetical protein [Chloroflexota bacterium]NOH10230.1 hypothetical protein [Chloroflexota bacterium]